MPPDAPPFDRFTFLRWLTPHHTALATDDAGRQVVLKSLEEDCLLENKLHPSIRDRLARVRELAHPGIANLHGVERVAGKSWLIWEFVPGQNLEEYLAPLAGGPEKARLTRELLLIVQALHTLGIVHGAIHGRNIIIDPLGKIRLTHISPLLYDDPATDVHDLMTTLGEETATDQSLKQLRQRLARDDPRPTTAPEPADHRARRKTILAAAILTLGGIATSGILWRTLRASTPAPLVPPEAPANLTAR